MIPAAEIREWIDETMTEAWETRTSRMVIPGVAGEHWWQATCDVTCNYLLARLNERFALDARVQHGMFRVHTFHVWLRLGDGTIIDPTSSQFSGMPHIAIIPSDSPLRGDYS